MHRVNLAILLLTALGATLRAEPPVIDVPMDASWQATPGWAPTEKAVQHSREFRNGVGTFRAAGGGRVMIWVRNPQPPLDVSQMRYVTLRYRLQNTDDSLYSYFLYLDTGESGGMYAHNLAFGANDLIHDGQWHTATTTLHPYGTIGTLALRFRALDGREGQLDVEYLRFTAGVPRTPLSENLDWQPGATGLVGEPIPLGTLCQTPLPDLQRTLALADWFSAAEITASGVGFRVSLADAVAASTGVPERQDLTVPVGRSAAALSLLLGAGFPYKMLSYEGWQPGDMTDRPEQFRVAIRYADGSVVEQVPFCLAKDAHGVWRGVHAYALSLTPASPVKELVLHDGMRTSAFHLIALTAAARPLVPPVPEAPERTPIGAAAAEAAPALTLNGGILTVSTGAGELGFDPNRGLALVRLVNARHRDWPVQAAGAPLFSAREGDRVWAGDGFRLASVPVVTPGRAEISYVHDSAKVELAVTVEATATEARLAARARNLDARDRTLDVTWPRVELAPRVAPDLWYFYPSMCPAWSNADKLFDLPYSGQFPVQFMDVYDRRLGGGLHLGTRERSARQRYFQLRKAGNILAMGVEYRSNPPLPAGQWVELPLSYIGLHPGDWRSALQAYRDWLATWCRPVTPRLDWYGKVWNFRTWWTHTMGDGKPEWNLLNPQTGEFQTADFVRRDREQFGQIDMVHFFDWRISKQYGAYGDFSHYEDIGGLDRFRAMVRQLQADGIRVGLYLDCYLCSRKSLVGQAHGEEWALRRWDGRLGDNYSTKDDPMLNLCVLHPGWQDHLATACARAVRETGCDGVYLDEGMTDYSAYWCWSKDHGHGVPGTNQAGLLELCRKVRTALPPGAALYTEWSPADVFIPYLDGAYQASLRSSEIRVSPGFLQLARFVFPDFRVFTISNAGSMYDGIWEGTKFNLFNGVPLYSLSWGHDEECLPLIRRMSRLLHEHADAFRTGTPEPYIETERQSVFANAFPGPSETVWTLWNGRYQTLTGSVLRVRHVAGARYLDLWNETDLVPVIEGEVAVLGTTLGPRGIGAVAQVRSPQRQ